MLDVIPAAFKYVKTRKQHACEGCEKAIPKGSMSLSVHGKVGVWFTEYWCWACDVDRINAIPDEFAKLRKKLFDEKACLQISGQFLKISPPQ